MKSLYNILTHTIVFPLKIVSIFNGKIQLGVKGRAETFSILKSKLSIKDKTIWFHCASLGEYEQGLPVFGLIKKKHPNHKIILSFFSPSGYEIRKKSPIADVVIYLPLDTKANAKKFINITHPELVVFVKYDIWPNYLQELINKNIRAILISAVFREEQRFFKFYGAWMQKSLRAFEHIFVQDEHSKTLLESVHFNNVTVSGDTRFDRVSNQLKIDNTLEFIKIFKQDKLCVVAGSTWPEDENLFIDYINASSNDIKFIIAPHNIKANQIEQLKQRIKKSVVLFSEKEKSDISTNQVFVIDTIGILSKTYSYADIAYVGGAMGNTGLHNTLEPAVFGVPIIIGNHFSKFPEAHQMIKNGGLFSISDQKEFNEILNNLIQKEDSRQIAGDLNAAYISKNKGAVTIIMSYINITN
ncbi:3-deoxy-D-manno-octulosonic acid transferase [Flavobacteriaceae bacterium AU392]|nr:3-deoxy-D-manno-octulosonic acid transferase [Flavobacteriaceae bacterium]RKM81582.1 3-deoxy-D-manno-octulosonic acid transferase [Flavobacteriaceae bacterium AU392]